MHVTHTDLPLKGFPAKLAGRRDRHLGQLALAEGGHEASILSKRRLRGIDPDSYRFPLVRLNCSYFLFRFDIKNWPADFRPIGKSAAI